MLSGDDVLSDLQNGVESILKDSTDLDDSEVLELAKGIRERFRSQWGGQNIYFKKGIPKEPRNREIFNKFDGTNVSQLSKDYSLCAQAIYNILAKERASCPKKVDQ